MMRASCRFKLRVVLLCILWYVISSTGSIINKILLQTYPYPMTVGLSSLMCIPLCTIPLLKMWEVREIALTKAQFNRYLLPISIGKALAVASANFSLWKMPVSYTHTVKATMPLFAVLLGRIVLKEKQSWRIYLSLLPIVVGVVIASATELSFSMIGLLSALFSTFVYSFLNILVKKVLHESEIHPIRLLSLNAQLAALLYFPFWLYEDALSMWSSWLDTSSTITQPDLHMILLLFLSGVLSFGQNVCAFTLIHELTALSYAVCNATKRITVISASLLTLHNPVTAPNVFGMTLSVVGVFCYNRAKQREKETTHSLPLTRTHTTLSDAHLVAMDTLAMKRDEDEQVYRKSLPANGGSRLAHLVGASPDTVERQRNHPRMDDISMSKEARRSGKFA